MYHRCVYFQDSAYEYYRMGCERGHPRACLHAGVMDTYAPGVPITLTGNEEFSSFAVKLCLRSTRHMVESRNIVHICCSSTSEFFCPGNKLKCTDSCPKMIPISSDLVLSTRLTNRGFESRPMLDGNGVKAMPG